MWERVCVCVCGGGGGVYVDAFVDVRGSESSVNEIAMGKQSNPINKSLLSARIYSAPRTAMKRK